jgi:hypothetical protein
MPQNPVEFPKSINIQIAGMESVSLAFMGNQGVQGVWEQTHVPTKALTVAIKTYPLENRPGGPQVTVVTITPKELLGHRIGFQLIHTANPSESITVTVQTLLLGG